MMKRKIGLDVGDKTVGIAVSDPLGITAQGLMTLERVGIRKDTGKILDLVKEYDCDTIVIGLNKKLDGTDSIQTEKMYEFRTMLENKMRSTAIKGVEVVWQLIDSHFKQGGTLININILDKEKLLEANENPELHPDLVPCPHW